jgi:hypothetical protein
VLLSWTFGVVREAGSRTRVIVFTGLQSYRFFAAFCSECDHATGFLQRGSVPIPFPQNLLRQPRPTGMLRSPARRHVRAVAPSYGRGMLLPLRGSTTQGWLRKTLRFEEIRATRLGHQVREAAYANTGQGFERRATISSSRPRGTRGTTRTVLVLSCRSEKQRSSRLVRVGGDTCGHGWT